MRHLPGLDEHQLLLEAECERGRLIEDLGAALDGDRLCRRPGRRQCDRVRITPAPARRRSTRIRHRAPPLGAEATRCDAAATSIKDMHVQR